MWRRYARALKQRNALLKTRPGADAAGRLGAGTGATAASRSPAPRQRYLDAAAAARCSRRWTRCCPAAGRRPARLPARLAARRTDAGRCPAAGPRARPRRRAFTAVGPHRADWRIGFSRACRAATALSRGQAKLTALALLLAQAEHHAAAARRMAGHGAGRSGLRARSRAPAPGAGSDLGPAAPRSSSPAPKRPAALLALAVAARHVPRGTGQAVLNGWTPRLGPDRAFMAPLGILSRIHS